MHCILLAPTDVSEVSEVKKKRYPVLIVGPTMNLTVILITLELLGFLQYWIF